MTFPNYKGKHAEDSLFSPSDFFQYYRQLNMYPTFEPPLGVVFCYQTSLKEYVLANHKTTRVAFSGAETYLIDETGGKVAIVANFGIGSPVACTLLEEFIGFGVERFISVGTAGTLQKGIKVGDLVVCDKAIRDEGTSHHYLKRSKYAYASKDMTRRIIGSLEKLNQKYVVGTSWTIDAPYRETVAEARQYQEEGVATVEMEASALFAVSSYRNVDMGALFTISDSLAALKWKPKFHAQETKKGLETLFRVALDVLNCK